MSESIIFFDQECPFCRRAVRQIINRDERANFLFAPLNGETAKEILIGPQARLALAQSIILVEDYRSDGRKFYIHSRAIFRIYWLIGGWWRLLGVFGFFPCWISDALYRYFAAHRHQFKLKNSQEIGPKERMLP